MDSKYYITSNYIFDYAIMGFKEIDLEVGSSFDGSKYTDGILLSSMFDISYVMPASFKTIEDVGKLKFFGVKKDGQCDIEKVKPYQANHYINSNYSSTSLFRSNRVFIDFEIAKEDCAIAYDISTAYWSLLQTRYIFSKYKPTYSDLSIIRPILSSKNLLPYNTLSDFLQKDVSPEDENLIILLYENIINNGTINNLIDIIKNGFVFGYYFFKSVDRVISYSIDKRNMLYLKYLYDIFDSTDLRSSKKDCFEKLKAELTNGINIIKISKVLK